MCRYNPSGVSSCGGPCSACADRGNVSFPLTVGRIVRDEVAADFGFLVAGGGHGQWLGEFWVDCGQNACGDGLFGRSFRGQSSTTTPSSSATYSRSRTGDRGCGQKSHREFRIATFRCRLCRDSRISRPSVAAIQTSSPAITGDASARRRSVCRQRRFPVSVDSASTCLFWLLTMTSRPATAALHRYSCGKFFVFVVPRLLVLFPVNGEHDTVHDWNDRLITRRPPACCRLVPPAAAVGRSLFPFSSRRHASWPSHPPKNVSVSRDGWVATDLVVGVVCPNG